MIISRHQAEYMPIKSNQTPTRHSSNLFNLQFDYLLTFNFQLHLFKEYINIIIHYFEKNWD